MTDDEAAVEIREAIIVLANEVEERGKAIETPLGALAKATERAAAAVDRQADLAERVVAHQKPPPA